MDGKGTCSKKEFLSDESNINDNLLQKVISCTTYHEDEREYIIIEKAACGSPENGKRKRSIYWGSVDQVEIGVQAN